MSEGIFDKAAAATGVGAGELQLLFCFLAAYPLGSIFVRIPRTSPELKHLFSIGISLWFLLGILNLWAGTALVLSSALFTYIVSASSKTTTGPWLVFGVVMGQLLISHVYRIMYPTDRVEISGAQMVLTMKLTTFAWNVYDGRRPVEDLDKAQLETRIVKFPSILAFLGYTLYYPAMLIGPAITYSEYMSMVDESAYASYTPGASKSSGKRVPTGRKKAAFWKMLIGVVNMAVYAVYGGQIAYPKMLESWFQEKSFLYRLMYTQLCGIVARTKFYGAWSMTEGACIFSGYGYSGYDTKTGATFWDKAANIDIMNIEFAPNFKVLLDSWNMKTNAWLRECVYKRVTPKGQKPGFASSQLTFLTSAVWHGVYGGYYLTFLFGGFMSAAARQSRAYLRPFFLPPLLPPKATNIEKTFIKRVYDVVGTLTTLILLNYTVIPFIVLGTRDSITAWARLNWYGHIVVGAWLLVGTIGGKAWLKAAIKARVKRAESKQEAAGLKNVQEKSLKERDVTEDGVQVAPVHNAVKEVESKVYDTLKDVENIPPLRRINGVKNI